MLKLFCRVVHHSLARSSHVDPREHIMSSPHGGSPPAAASPVKKESGGGGVPSSETFAKAFLLGSVDDHGGLIIDGRKIEVDGWRCGIGCKA